MGGRVALISAAEGTCREETVDTVARPFMEDLMTGSSFVLSSTRSCIGMGFQNVRRITIGEGNC